MDTASETFRQTLKHTPDTSSLLWTITTRKALFRHLNSRPKNFGGHLTYSVRVDGALKSLEVFIELVRGTQGTSLQAYPDWEAMIWGSAALVLAHFFERSTGHEQILVMFEDLTITPTLPSSIRLPKSELPQRIVLQVFAELSTQLLRLALALETYPQAPQKKHVKFQEFENNHMKTVERIKCWADRLKNILFAGGAPNASQAENVVPLPSEMIPVNVNKHFHGRKQNLQKLRERLQCAAERPAAVGVHGLPGMGKTQFAARYCMLFGTEYFACIWVAADSHSKIGNTFSDYAIRLKLEGTSLEAEPRRNAQALVSWLQTTERPWLLVLDNVDDFHHLEGFWPSGGSGHVIITSRSPYVAEFRGSSPMELEPLSSTEARELFYMIVGENKKTQHTEKIDALLDEWRGVPLALYHIGSYISRLHIDMARFLRLYRRSATRIYQSKSITDEYPHSIATAFSVAELERDSKSLLRALCYFDPDKIPIDLLLSSFDYGEPILPFESEIDLCSAQTNLCSSGLLSQIGDNVQVHRLVQAVAFTDMDRQEQVDFCTRVLSLLNRKFPREIEGKSTWENWPYCDEYLPHVMFICGRWRELFAEDLKNGELASLLSACTWYMVERGLFAEAEPLIMTAQEVCPDSGEAQLTLATVLFNLAGVRFECNRIRESLVLCKKVLAIRERMLEPSDPLLGNTLYSIGIVYMEAGQLQESLRSNLRAVAIHEGRQLNGKHDGSPTALAYLDLGLCYWKMGDLELASTYVEKGLELFRKTTSVFSQKYGQGLSYLALVREAQNRTHEAMEATRASLEICQAITPSEFKTGLGFHKLAGFFQKEGDLEKALDHIQRALEILENSFDSVPRVARSLFKMAEILKELGREDEAAVKTDEARRLRGTITTFEYDPALTEEAFDRLVPSFLA